MGRPCGGAHEISGIPVPLCLHGWVVGWFMGQVSGGGVGGVLVRGWWWSSGDGGLVGTQGKFLILGKFVDLMEDLKYEHQSIFPLLERVILNFGDR